MAVRMGQVPGKEHHIPRELIPFIIELESLVGSKRVGFGEFTRRGYQKRELEARLYDGERNLLTVRARTPEYTQIIKVSISPNEEIGLRNYINNYEF